MTMRIYDIITKKKHGEELTDAEIAFVIEGYTNGDIPDYQISALMMAIYFKGMCDRETATLTREIARSGNMLDLSAFGHLTVDKHSTGGVGDKTTLIVAPIAASLGCKVAKMSGRGLGHTGGTVDKLESFPGFNTSLTPDEFFSQVDRIGIAVIGQSGNLAPADKKLYALRDVTATVDSIPLITSSIMGKKLAAGSHSIVLDVKCGSGSFMKTPEDAGLLAEKMVEIGKRNGRNIAALITNMDIPLGHAIGNSLEIKEAVSVLEGGGPLDLRTVCLELATNMVALSLGLEESVARERVTDALKSGKALAKFKEWIVTQGGDPAYANDPHSLPVSSFSRDIVAGTAGYIARMNAEEIGIASVGLGAGRETKEDVIDPSAGIIVYKKVGEHISVGDVIATLYSNKEQAFDAAEKKVLGAITVADERPEDQRLIYRVIK